MDPLVASVANEDLLVELLNTTPVIDESPVEKLDAAWVSDRGCSAGDVGALRRLRADLQDVVRGRAEPVALNERLRALAVFPELLSDGTVTWRSEQEPSTGLEQRILLGWISAASARPGRLRGCGNNECNLFLLDRSRSGVGRWCSMATCGNRLKARRFSAKKN